MRSYTKRSAGPMIRHYLTFAHEAAALDAVLRGWVAAECWSQEKNFLLLRFIRGRDSVFVEIALDARMGFASPRADMHRARRNTIDFFAPIIGVQLVGVVIDDAERAIRMRFADGHVLAIFFFGGGGGNVLLLRDGVVGSFMKYSGEYDALLSPVQAEPSPEIPELLRRLRSPAESPLRAVMAAVPSLGRRLAVEALYRSGLEGAASLGGVDDVGLEGLLEAIDVLIGACEASSAYLVYHIPGDVVLALTELRTLNAVAVRVERFTEIGEAVRAYRAAWHETHAFTSLRDRTVKRLQHEVARLERSLANRLDAGAHAERAEAWERDGRLLMAHLHEVERGVERAVLTDWEGAGCEVPLDPKLTPHENAERYFRRARGARDAMARAAAGVEKNRVALHRAAALLDRATHAVARGELEAIQRNNNDLFVMAGEAKDPGTAERFRRFEVAGGHDVYAGKNAANNDELTVRFARPNDYWFHARGTSGSHVVLRWNDPKTKPPKETLRQAASIAAYYSGARGAKMVPVAYTLKKHVRKPRGSAPGSVLMEREDVLMAEPRLPQGSEEG